MATEHTAPALHLVQPRPLTGAERAKAYRQRKKAKAGAHPNGSLSLPAPSTSQALSTPAYPNGSPAVTLDVTPAAPVTADRGSTRTSKAPYNVTSFALRLSALALAGVGLSMNAVYARSLGSSDLSGWLFLALGLSADCAALALPTVAASAWRSGNRTTTASAWATWAAVFAFALLGSVGFASTSISDTVMARASRVTPQVTAAQGAPARAYV